MAIQIRKDDLEQLRFDTNGVAGSYVKIRYHENNKGYEIRTVISANDLVVLDEKLEKVQPHEPYASPAMKRIYDIVKTGKYRERVNNKYDKWELYGVMGLKFLKFIYDQEELSYPLNRYIPAIEKILPTYDKKLTNETRKIRQEAMEEINQITDEINGKGKVEDFEILEMI